MAVERLQFVYNGAALTAPTNGPGFIRAPFGGKIKKIKIYTNRDSGTLPPSMSQSSLWDIRLNGVLQFEGDEIEIADIDFSGEKTGLDIDVSEGDRIYFDLVELTEDSVPAPFVFQVWFDDDAEQSAISMQSVLYVTSPVADEAEETGTVEIGKSFILTKITADKQCRVRVYQSAAYRTADAGRAIGEAPTGEHGVVLDAYILASNLTLDLSPTPIGNSAESSRTATTAIAIQNLSGSTGTVEVTFYYLILEA